MALFLIRQTRTQQQEDSMQILAEMTEATREFTNRVRHERAHRVLGIGGRSFYVLPAQVIPGKVQPTGGKQFHWPFEYEIPPEFQTVLQNRLVVRCGEHGGSTGQFGSSTIFCDKSGRPFTPFYNRDAHFLAGMMNAKFIIDTFPYHEIIVYRTPNTGGRDLLKISVVNLAVRQTRYAPEVRAEEKVLMISEPYCETAFGPGTPLHHLSSAVNAALEKNHCLDCACPGHYVDNTAQVIHFASTVAAA